MKRLGFLTGAVLAAVGVFVFHTLRVVDDDDRLMAALAEECLPYVFGGQDVPFENLGRSPGVYDVVDVDDRVTGGGLRLIHDLRFLAQWGVVETAVGAVRICEVNPTFGENTIAAFEVDPDGFVGRYTDVIGAFAPLIPEREEVISGPVGLGWFEEGRQPDSGARVVMVVSPGLVSSVLIARDLP